ncbi:hypothetical protein TNCV_2271331 [Trichonephila clavipes]|nr:hypothetical protein TNCV_2271331 [Trichonephila clavipes]
MALSSFRVRKTRPIWRTSSSASTEKNVTNTTAERLRQDVVVIVPRAQDATGQQNSASTEIDEHPPPSGCGRLSLSSFRVHKTRPDSIVVSLIVPRAAETRADRTV